MLSGRGWFAQEPASARPMAVNAFLLFSAGIGRRRTVHDRRRVLRFGHGVARISTLLFVNQAVQDRQGVGLSRGGATCGRSVGRSADLAPTMQEPTGGAVYLFLIPRGTVQVES